MLFGNKNNSEKQQIDVEAFTVFDAKVNAYGTPVFAINRHDLVRQIVNMFRDPAQTKNMYFTNAEDYQVFKIGEYSKTSGCLTSHQPEHIANMHELRAMVLNQTQPGSVPT